jgi:hypothetical protein
MDYNKLYHLTLHHDPKRWITEIQLARMLNTILGWEWELCEKAARKRRTQVILTAPLETVERLAERISNFGICGNKVSIRPVAGNVGRVKTWSKGPCCIGKISRRSSSCEGPLTSKTAMNGGEKFRYWICTAHKATSTR